MVARPNERPGLHVAESHLQCFVFQFSKLTRRIKTRHGQMVARWAQILADGEDVALDGSQVAENVEQFGSFFANANHYAGFRHAHGPEFFGIAKKFERSFITGARTNHAIEARHRFGVVVQDIGLSIDYGTDRFRVSLKIGNEHFDAASRSLPANLVDDHGENARTADEVVIAIDAGDDGMFEAEGCNGFSDAARLVEVDGLWATFGYRTKAA